jgi:sialate O-acetylesterase
MNPALRHVMIALSLSLCLAASAFADVTLHALFSDNAVLQQQMKVPIWGTAAVDEKVTVQFQKQTVATSATNGEWKVVLKPLRAGGPFSLVARGANTITRTNILVGEVWVCSGQSNMQWPLSSSENPQAAVTNAADPMLRLITVPNTHADMPQRDVKASWVGCAPDTARGFSAVAYFFGRDLRTARKVPVGLIHSSWGGSPAETWTPRSYFESDPVLKPIIQEYDRVVQSYPQRLTEYKQAEAELLKKHEEAVAKAKAEGKQAPQPPRPPGDPAMNAHRPAALYNAMIASLQPFAIRGAIWYQGESNAGDAWRYRTLFPTMIRAWRETWGQGDFPFLFVQLAPCGSPAEGVSRWAELREAQLFTSQTVPKTAMAVITDAGDCADIHPKRKEPVGARLALAARTVAHGERIVSSGPVYQSAKIEGDHVTLTFQNAGGGLVAMDGELKGFIIAGSDQRFVPAKAEIKGNTVVVSSPDVKQPEAVRYGWADCPSVNLFNKEGLPATPFRTDDFPMVTKPK